MRGEIRRRARRAMLAQDKPGAATTTCRTAPTRVAMAELSASVPMRTATSNPSSTRSTGRSTKVSAIDTSGKRPRNSVTIGNTCSRPNTIGAVMRSSPRGAVPSPAAARSISSKSASTRRAPDQEARPGLGQADGAGRPVEEPHTQTVLQVGDRAGDGGRRTLQPPGRVGKAAALGHLDEDRQRRFDPLLHISQ